jgi:hypothetical protein
MKEDEMGGTYNTFRGNMKCKQYFGWKFSRKEVTWYILA